MSPIVGGGQFYRSLDAIIISPAFYTAYEFINRDQFTEALQMLSWIEKFLNGVGNKDEFFRRYLTNYRDLINRKNQSPQSSSPK